MYEPEDPTTPHSQTRHRKRWSEQELIILAGFYSTEGAHGVYLRLNGTRDVSYIYQKACKMGLPAPTVWSLEQERELERLVESGLDIDEVCRQLGRTASGVEQKYRKIRFQIDHLARRADREGGQSIPVDPMS